MTDHTMSDEEREEEIRQLREEIVPEFHDRDGVEGGWMSLRC